MKVPMMNAVFTEQLSSVFSQNACPQSQRVEVTAWIFGLDNPPLYHPCTAAHKGRELTLLSQRKKQQPADSSGVNS